MARQLKLVTQQDFTNGLITQNLSNGFDSRQTLLKITMQHFATDTTASVHYVDYNSGPLLSVGRIELNVDGDTKVSVSGQQLGVINRIYHGRAGMFVTAATGSSVTPGTSYAYVPLKHIFVGSGRPIDATLSKFSKAYIQITPTSTASHVASNAGFTIVSLKAELVSDWELRPGSGDYVPMQRYIKQSKSGSLTASSPNQAIVWNAQNGQKIKSVTLMVGSTGSVGESVILGDFITKIQLQMNGTDLFPPMDPNYLKLMAKMDRDLNYSTDDVLPSTTAGGVSYNGDVGIYTFSFNSDEDNSHGTLPQLQGSSGDYQLLVDTNSSGVYFATFVESYIGNIPAIPKAAKK